MNRYNPKRALFVLFLLFVLLSLFPKTGICDEIQKPFSGLLLHLKKGVITGNALTSFKLKSIFEEFQYRIENIYFVKDYAVEDMPENIVEVFILHVQDMPDNLLSFCHVLENESDVILAEPVDGLPEKNVIP